MQEYAKACHRRAVFLLNIPMLKIVHLHYSAFEITTLLAPYARQFKVLQVAAE